MEWRWVVGTQHDESAIDLPVATVLAVGVLLGWLTATGRLPQGTVFEVKAPKGAPNVVIVLILTVVSTNRSAT